MQIINYIKSKISLPISDATLDFSMLFIALRYAEDSSTYLIKCKQSVENIAMSDDGIIE